MTALVSRNTQGRHRRSVKIFAGEHDPLVHRVIVITEHLIVCHDLYVGNPFLSEDCRSSIGPG
jgi:hypothetical protein